MLTTALFCIISDDDSTGSGIDETSIVDGKYDDDDDDDDEEDDIDEEGMDDQDTGTDDDGEASKDVPVEHDEPKQALTDDQIAHLTAKVNKQRIITTYFFPSSFSSTLSSSSLLIEVPVIVNR